MLSKPQPQLGVHNDIKDRINFDIHSHVVQEDLREMPKWNVNFEDFPALTKSQPISFDSFSSDHPRKSSHFPSIVLHRPEISQLAKKKKVKKKRNQLDKYSHFIDPLSSTSLYERDVLWPANNADDQHSGEALFHAGDDEGFADGVDEVAQEKQSMDEFKPPRDETGDTAKVLASSMGNLDWPSRKQLVSELPRPHGNGNDTGYGSPALQVLTAERNQSAAMATGAQDKDSGCHRADQQKGDDDGEELEDEEEDGEGGREELEGTDLLHLISNSLDRFNASLHPACRGVTRSDEFECTGEEIDAVHQQAGDAVMRHPEAFTSTNSTKWWCSSSISLTTCNNRFNLPASYPEQGACFPASSLFQPDLLPVGQLLQQQQGQHNPRPQFWITGSQSLAQVSSSSSSSSASSSSSCSSTPPVAVTGSSLSEAFSGLQTVVDDMKSDTCCCSCSYSSSRVRKCSDSRQTRQSLRLLNVFDGGGAGGLVAPDLGPLLPASENARHKLNNNNSLQEVHQYACRRHDRYLEMVTSTGHQWSDRTADSQPIQTSGLWPKAVIQPSGDDAQIASMVMCNSPPACISRQGDENVTRASAGADASPLLSMLLEQASGCSDSLVSRLMEDLALTTTGSPATLITSNHDNACANSQASSSLLPPAMLFDFDSDVPVTKTAGLIATLGLADQGRVNGANQMEVTPETLARQPGQFGLSESLTNTDSLPVVLGNQVSTAYNGAVSMMSQSLYPPSRRGTQLVPPPASSASSHLVDEHGHQPSTNWKSRTVADAYFPGDDVRASRKTSSGSMYHEQFSSQLVSGRRGGSSLFPPPPPTSTTTVAPGLRRRDVNRLSSPSVGWRSGTAAATCIGGATLHETAAAAGGKPLVAKWRRACSFYLRGHCKKEDCEFAHDLTKVTCKFWEMSECFKGSTCPFLHGYPSDPAEALD